ncbi:hypothetical protein [Pontixanthobacter sp.]|uniref:hypothetical protein n=1 Tax=Pontixanthobacter sp. TaxID=2792078 RepID=UPI003C7E351B
MSTTDNRSALKDKIDAAEARNALRSAGSSAGDAAAAAGDFIKRHPLATMAGVAVIGLAIGAMTKPGREVGRKVSSNAGELSRYASEIGLAYISGLMDSVGDAVDTGKDALTDLGDTVSDNAGAARRRAAFVGANATAAAKSFSRDAGKKAGRALRIAGKAAKH